MKPRSQKAADPARAAEALLTLFSADQTWIGRPYTVPGEAQLRFSDSMWGCGNAAAGENTFENAMSLYAGTDCREQRCRPVEDALANRRFSVACGAVDPCWMAARSIVTLAMQRQVRKFVVLVRGATEREMLSRTLAAYTEQAGREFGFRDGNADGYLQGDGPEVTMYAGGGRDMSGEGMRLCLRQLRRFVTDPTPQVLLMNREYFTRPANLLTRPSADLEGTVPMSMLTPGSPVIVTVSEDAASVRTLLQRAAVFAPLCSLSFTVKTDRSGTTVPVYTPGGQSTSSAGMTMAQISI